MSAEDEVARLRQMAEQPSDEVRREHELAEKRDHEVVVQRLMGDPEVAEKRLALLLQAWEEVERQYPLSPAERAQVEEVYRRSQVYRPSARPRPLTDPSADDDPEWPPR